MADEQINGRWRRWALRHRERGFFLGKYCWPDGKHDEFPTRTFRTRTDARHARQQLTSYREECEVVAVFVGVELDRRTAGPGSTDRRGV